MAIYIINIIISGILASTYQARINTIEPQYSLMVKRGKAKDPNNILLFLLLIMWVAIYAFRFHVGTDSFSFYDSYIRYLVDGKQTLPQFLDGRRDYLFCLIEYGCNKIFNGSWVGLNIVLGLLTYIPIIKVIKKESDDYSFTVLLYIFTISFYSGFNITRQAISIGLAWYAYYYFFREKKYLKYVFMMLCAFGMHAGSMFVIPFHFLSRNEYKGFKTFRNFALIIVAYLVMIPAWPIIIRVLKLLGQEKMANDYTVLSSTVLNPIRLAVFMLPAILGIMFYRQLKDEYPNIDYLLLLICFGALMSMFGLRNVILTRIALYLSINEIIFIPKLMRVISREKQLGKVTTLLLYFIYMVLLLRVGEGHYFPYKTVFDFGVF